MANELSLGVSVNFQSSLRSLTKTFSAIQSITTKVFNHHIQVIGTSAENISIVSDIGMVGYMIVFNHSTAASVEILETGSASYMAHIPALGLAIIPYYGIITLQAKASAASTSIEFVTFAA